MVEKFIVSEKWIYRLTDANIDVLLLLYQSCAKYAQDFLNILQTYSFIYKQQLINPQKYKGLQLCT